jgi:chaperonin cofactor prefoldin
MLAQNRQIAAKIEELENGLDKHDTDLQEIVKAIKDLMTLPEPRAPGSASNCHQSGKN